MKFQKKKLKKMFPDVYDSNLTEYKIMRLAGYLRVFDCGDLSFSYQNNE
jgi:hypothetical protein